MILYLHGFRSSPSSMKARVTGQRMAELGRAAEFICPQLPASPKLAMELAFGLVAGIAPHELTIVGSSLGGYYATWMAEKLGCRAVLLNPAVVPMLDLDKHVGVTTAYHSDEPFEFKREYIEELRALAVPRVTQPERYFLIACTGDEVLDYRDMVAHYAGAKQKVVQGSDHAISEYADYLGEVLAFCSVTGEAR
ncbi:YqiA/YcfP family alpha/beta fold hydrolase [Pseudoduganella sp. OTU4001]|uniref:YqiA/YcfP family alpha/beta fold hydrolase n=1 Tax=Pseudoduganella sp. OTU4001 TaxID=3043854 RepID=UPI00313EDB2A